jgi:hypothetical protein
MNYEIVSLDVILAVNYSAECYDFDVIFVGLSFLH